MDRKADDRSFFPYHSTFAQFEEPNEPPSPKPPSWTAGTKSEEPMRKTKADVVAERLKEETPLAQSVLQGLETEVKRLDAATGRQDLKILFTIDEVHALADRPSSGLRESEHLKIDILFRSMNAFLRSNIFFLVLSTQSDMCFIGPPAHLIRSARYSDALKYLQPPITETPFDCFANLALSRVTLRMMYDPMFMAIFGRPVSFIQLTHNACLTFCTLGGNPCIECLLSPS